MTTEQLTPEGRALLEQILDVEPDASVVEMRALRAAVTRNAAPRLSLAEIEAMPTSKWLSSYEPADRARMLKEAQAEQAAEAARQPQETDQQRRVRVFDADMKAHHDRGVARDAARAQEQAQREQRLATAATPEAEARAARAAMRAVNSRIAKQGY